MTTDKALFIDLDHTLITTKSGNIFPLHSLDWKFLPETVKTVKHFYKRGFKIIIVSNQGGIEEGYMTERVFIHKIEAVCAALEKSIKLKKCSVAYSYCKKMVSYNRKPNPGMVYDAALEYELNLRESVMIGDLPSDEKLATNAGIGTYLNVTELVTFNLDTQE